MCSSRTSRHKYNKLHWIEIHSLSSIESALLFIRQYNGTWPKHIIHHTVNKWFTEANVTLCVWAQQGMWSIHDISFPYGVNPIQDVISLKRILIGPFYMDMAEPQSDRITLQHFDQPQLYVTLTMFLYHWFICVLSITTRIQ